MTFAVTLITFLIATLVWATNIAQSTIVTRAYSTDEGNISLEEIIQQSAAASFVPNTAFLWGEYLLVCEILFLFQEAEPRITSR